LGISHGCTEMNFFKSGAFVYTDISNNSVLVGVIAALVTESNTLNQLEH